MKIVRAEARFEGSPDGGELLRIIESAGRVCYKSEGRTTEDSAPAFVRGLIRRGHESVLEHASLRARIVCDRGVSHELVRHRLASYSQESTRYCNYSGDRFGSEVTFIRPPWVEIPAANAGDYAWLQAMRQAEVDYFCLLELGWSPQQARSVLPNSLKTEVVMTANLREWRHFFRLRCSPAAHPQMREITLPLLRQAGELVPAVFDDLAAEIGGEP